MGYFKNDVKKRCVDNLSALVVAMPFDIFYFIKLSELEVNGIVLRLSTKLDFSSL